MPMNFNIGLLGHVDSGKTSLAKKLSRIYSTASLDKNPQSQQRGITLDLGFSAIFLESSAGIKAKYGQDEVVFTFVDCPGHQSLIRTIIGGAQIIDMVVLVVDVQKGFEAQTGECLILSEVTRKPLIVVLNKIDLLEESTRPALIEKMAKKIRKTLDAANFKNSEIIPMSALDTGDDENERILMDKIMKFIESAEMTRNTKLPFIFAFDHCFTINGAGTILSGTILQGKIKSNDVIQFPQLKQEKKIKSMQMFKKPVTHGSCGDRLGICVTSFDSKLLERGLVCQENCLQYSFAVIIKLDKIKYFKHDIKSRSKFHCSIGHETTMGNILVFSSKNPKFSWDSTYEYEEKFSADETELNYFGLIEFETPVMVYEGILLIGSRLDSEQKNACRIAFHSQISMENSTSDKNYAQNFLPRLKIFKQKSKEGDIQRLVNDNEIISSLFKKETDRSKFMGFSCTLSTGETGKIMSSFGQASKVKIQFIKPLEKTTIELIQKSKHEVKVLLNFKKFIFNKNQEIVQ